VWIFRSQKTWSIECGLKINACQRDAIWFFRSSYCSNDKFIIYYIIIVHVCDTGDDFHRTRCFVALWRHQSQRVVNNSVVIRKIGSHTMKSTVSRHGSSIDGYIIKYIILFCRQRDDQRVSVFLINNSGPSTSQESFNAEPSYRYQSFQSLTATRTQVSCAASEP
jgi:hypothetical protein